MRSYDAHPSYVLDFMSHTSADIHPLLGFVLGYTRHVAENIDIFKHLRERLAERGEVPSSSFVSGLAVANL